VLVTPLSGPFARYGLAGAQALSLWARTAGAELAVHDAHPDPAVAMRAAAAMPADVRFGPYGAGPALAAFAATDRLVWNHGGASPRLRRPRFAHVVNVCPPGGRYFAGPLQAVCAADPGVRRVAMLHIDTGFGRAAAAGATESAAALGLELDAVPFVPGGAVAAARRLPGADVVLVAGHFDDEVAAAPVVLSRSWRAAAFVGAGTDEVLASLGAAREGLIGACPWLARVAGPPQDGPDSEWFVAAFRERTGSEPPYPAAAAFAAGVIAERCRRDAGAGAGEAETAAAAAALRTRTLFGPFALDPESGLQAAHEVLTVQWQRGRRVVVWPPHRAEAPLLHPFSTTF
jgi:branched-chain amino acid transport system substrate-binding protein